MFGELLDGPQPQRFGHLYLPGGSVNLGNPAFELRPGTSAPLIGKPFCLACTLASPATLPWAGWEDDIDMLVSHITIWYRDIDGGCESSLAGGWSPFDFGCGPLPHQGVLPACILEVPESWACQHSQCIAHSTHVIVWKPAMLGMLVPLKNPQHVPLQGPRPQCANNMPRACYEDMI